MIYPNGFGNIILNMPKCGSIFNGSPEADEAFTQYPFVAGFWAAVQPPTAQW
jgi:hypothetical protein